MAHRNVHQSKRQKSHKAAAAKSTAQAAPVTPTATTVAQTAAAPTAVKPTNTRVAAAQEPAAVRFAELPYELRRIGLFSAFVVVLLIVLWLFLK